MAYDVRAAEEVIAKHATDTENKEKAFSLRLVRKMDGS
jgi:hypothetical protein